MTLRFYRIVVACGGMCFVACGPSRNVDAGDAAADVANDVPAVLDALDGTDVGDASDLVETTIDAYDASDVTDADEIVDVFSEPTDSAPTSDALADGSPDTSDASACGIVGMACNPSSSTDCPSSLGFACFGLGYDAGAQGVCLASYLGRYVCGDGTNHCPDSADRCLRSYHFCLWPSEVPCVCGPYPSACAPP